MLMIDVLKIAARPLLTPETGDKQGTFSERKAAQYFRIMVEVIHHCHQLGVIHRCVWEPLVRCLQSGVCCDRREFDVPLQMAAEANLPMAMRCAGTSSQRTSC